jgi:zinc protease
MERMIRIALTALAALALGACASGTWPGQGRRGIAGMEGLTRTTLDNGLRVAIVEDHSAPVVALMVWVRVGSADERADQAGMAHVFEHMLFKGTERRGVGEIAATIEASGGNINAFTSFDVTAYFATMASRDASVGIDVLADALQHSSFDPTELEREAEVVIEEIRRSNDSPGRALSQTVFDVAYTQHPYRLPVIGTEQSVRSFSRQGLLEFFHHWYVPNNMTFVVVGDVDPAAALAQIREAFAGAKPDRELAHPRAAEPEPQRALARVVPSEFQQTLLGVAYKITGFEHADTPYLDLLSGVLGGGDASRLYRSVKDRQQLVHSIGSSSYTPRDEGLFMIDAVLDPAKLQASVHAIAQEVHRLRDLGASEAELERARVNLLASKVHERETMEGQANNLGYWEAIGGGIEREQAYLDAVKRATTDDLLRVAQRYLAPERARVVALLEKGAASATDRELLAALEDGSGTGRERFAGSEIHPGIWSYQLPNGLRVIVKPVHSIPLVSLHLSLRGGQLAESADRQGLSSFLAEMLERGTAQRSAAQFAAEVEDIAGNLSGFAGRNSFGLQAQFLKESLDTGLELLADALLRPALDPGEIEKVREEHLAAIKRREDSLSSKALELLQKGLYDAHPYAFLTLGTESSVAAINRDALRGYLSAYAHPRNAVLAVVGDVEPEALVEALAAHLGEWSGPASVAFPAHPLPELQRVQELSLAKQRNQVHIMLGFPGLRVGDPDVPALHVLTQVLSGQGGRLFLELRDRQSLAYQVQASSVEGLDPGMFMVYIASALEKESQARDGIRGELVKLLEDGVSDEELTRARSYLVGSNAVSLQRLGTQASLLSLDELYGMGATWHLGYASRIDRVTREDVMRVARRIIDLDRAVYAVVR